MYKHLLLVFLETDALIRLKILLMQSVNKTGIHNSLHSYLVAIQMILVSLSFFLGDTYCKRQHGLVQVSAIYISYNGIGCFSWSILLLLDQSIYFSERRLR
jgi:hypothetical protein